MIKHIYEDVQLAARRFLASRTLDAILSDRNEISDAENKAQRACVQAEQERARLIAETELEHAKLKIQADLEEAKALAGQPEFLRLRELQALEKMAQSGAQFVTGLGGDKLTNFLGDKGV